MSGVTTQQFRAVERAWDRIEKAHDCWGPWTVRVSTPGFGPDTGGMSRWCCDACAPLYALSVREACGAVEERPKAIHHD